MNPTDVDYAPSLLLKPGHQPLPKSSSAARRDLKMAFREQAEKESMEDINFNNT